MGYTENGMWKFRFSRFSTKNVISITDRVRPGGKLFEITSRYGSNDYRNDVSNFKTEIRFDDGTVFKLNETPASEFLGKNCK